MISESDEVFCRTIGRKKSRIEVKNIHIVILSHINANRNNMKYRKKKRGEESPFVRLTISIIIDMSPNSSTGLPEKREEGDFDLFLRLIYMAEKMISIASR